MVLILARENVVRAKMFFGFGVFIFLLYFWSPYKLKTTYKAAPY